MQPRRPLDRSHAARRVPHVVLLVIAALALVVVSAPPAAAHGGEEDTSSFRSEITSDPTEGVSWRIIGGDGMLELHSSSAAPLVVFGYEDEPYLRFDPDGTVWRNAASPATYLNASIDAATDVPPTASAAAEARWEQVADDGTYAWHDHRTHWMSARPPDGDQAEVVQEWSVPFAVGDAAPMQLTGELWWAPAPNPLPCLLVAAAVLTVPLVEVARRRRWDPAVAARFLGIEAVAVAALNVVRAVDDVLTVDADTSDHVGVLVATGFWVGLSLVANQHLIRRPERANVAVVAIAGGSLAWGLGVSTLSALAAPFVQTSLPLPVLRAIVAMTLAIAVPTVVTAVLVERRYRATLAGRRRPVTSAA